MDHGTALKTKASERYLLSEMSESERFEFEAHYFACEECADDVSAGLALERGAKEVLTRRVEPERSREFDRESRGPFRWLSAPTLIPLTAAGVLAVVAGYQTFVLLPSRGVPLSARAWPAVILRPVVRGGEAEHGSAETSVPSVVVSPAAGSTVFAMDVNGFPNGGKLTYELIANDGTVRGRFTSQIPDPNRQIVVEIPNKDLAQPGRWTLVLRADGAEIARCPFQVELR
jgi:hypothetical protein